MSKIEEELEEYFDKIFENSNCFYELEIDENDNGLIINHANFNDIHFEDLAIEEFGDIEFSENESIESQQKKMSEYVKKVRNSQIWKDYYHSALKARKEVMKIPNGDYYDNLEISFNEDYIFYLNDVLDYIRLKSKENSEND